MLHQFPYFTNTIVLLTLGSSYCIGKDSIRCLLGRSFLAMRKRELVLQINIIYYTKPIKKRRGKHRSGQMNQPGMRQKLQQ